jgi:hypothetical protein
MNQGEGRVLTSRRGALLGARSRCFSSFEVPTDAKRVESFEIVHVVITERMEDFPRFVGSMLAQMPCAA